MAWPTSPVPVDRLHADSRSYRRSDYPFVNNVRFLSMVAIVWVHSEFLWGRPANGVYHIQPVLLQLMKFGTIGFFLISGFLLGEGLTRDSPRQYFYRRFHSVFVPWLFWGFLWLMIAVSSDFLGGNHADSLRSSLRLVAGQYVRFVFTQSIYWYVPNFFVCMAIVIGLYRRVPDYVQGATYLAMSLLYGVNVYLEIIPTRHTSALLGFVFYLWLGSFAYKHREALSRWLSRISWMRLIMYASIAGGLALVETHVLRLMHRGDSANILRISNQVYAVLAVLMIVKCRRRLYPASIDVRAETFGIYLIHPILIEIYYIAAAHLPVPKGMRIDPNGPLTLLVGVAMFLAIYVLSLTATKQINKVSSLRWIVGR
jgi:membrane-bound acyltransferase YfiQ involved in biofilm formation